MNDLLSKQRLAVGFAWSLSAIVVFLAILAWGQDLHWQLGHLNAYQLFPLLGLLAFSLMWAHYLAGLPRDYLKLDKTLLKNYFEATSFVVLALICLHPGLLIFQRFRDGYGLPPHSYESYVAPGMAWITLLGTASFLVFIAYEFRRLFADRSWWKYVANASDVAMLAIFYHGLRLGDDLQQGWFKKLWLFYGVTLVLAIIYKYTKPYLATNTVSQQSN